MYETTIIARFGGNLVKKREWVRNRVMRRDKDSGKVYAHEMKGHEYMVFIGVDADDTTCYGHQTRCFGSKTEALKYARQTKPVDRLMYSVKVA